MLRRFSRMVFVAATVMVAAHPAHAEGDETGAVIRALDAGQLQESAVPPVSDAAPAESDSPASGVLGYTAPEVIPPSERRSPLERIIGHNREGERVLRPLIARYAAAEGVPFDIANAVVRIESRYNPKAKNGPNLGLMQVSLPTARSLGYSGDAAGLMDGETNIRYGMKYLGQAYVKAGGDLCGTILRYQAGHRSVTMTPAARTYCNKVKMLLAETK